ncbi:alpha-1,6-mannosyl-glycoprotein 2-beta-N-acetylglucosaminyltransferase-like [Helicoverpa zea]|uniref:alpha-1,6-mannosyl-glycoprotein 2-beta-N-acetylglucosaminyltransferase-like n=1 Tax=Helicoverpa zea TaxID=7113 RepID=UPI001F5A86B1|nr:alpha-1,6-mannosyl-glycoprotein 2-beta-N-acetylglucosaminyltransferase-like [Helicoverpa zea]
MSLNPEHFVRMFIIIFVVVMSTICYGIYQQVKFVKRQRKDLLHNFNDDGCDNITYSDYVQERFRIKRHTMQNILKMKAQIRKINSEQTVYNQRLGPIGNDTYIIVIQVHSNVYYLQQLLLSLKVANGIRRALLIFSHDYFSHEINTIIRNINFAKYIQIFFPYSIQLHPHVFPGNDEQFCNEGYVCKKSKLRDPEAAQAKHHWWWGVNQVFDNMEVTKGFNSTILFLEEGDYVTEDFIYAYKLIKQARYLHCPFCEVLSLGAHEPEISKYEKKTMITVEVWTNTLSRSGIAFNRQIWNALKANSREFCYHDDYNWDNSFRHVGIKKWEGNVYLTAIAGTRVFHLDKCDEKDVGCKMEYKVAEVEKFINIVLRKLYPWGIIMVVNREEEFNGTAAGLFGDIRDRELCMYFTEHSVWY